MHLTTSRGLWGTTCRPIFSNRISRIISALERPGYQAVTTVRYAEVVMGLFSKFSEVPPRYHLKSKRSSKKFIWDKAPLGPHPGVQQIQRFGSASELPQSPYLHRPSPP
ncbi:hypothetical protein MGN70_014296 [Eutypa lata]|nr:hypothetical protein MGN70_014296 [Eutypa lata]